MDFLRAIWQHLQEDEARPAVTEIHDGRLVPIPRKALREQIERLQGALPALGVRPGDRVALIGANSARWIALHLALLLREAVTVPVYHRLTDPEMLEIIQDSGAGLVLVEDEDLLERLRRDAPDPPPRMMSFQAIGDRREPAQPLRLPTGDRLASIMYTSGSTGHPKGVLIATSNLDYLCEQMRNFVHGIAPIPVSEMRIIQYFPFAFSAAQSVLWNQLCSGENLYLANGLSNFAGDSALVRPHGFLAVPLLLERIKAAAEARIQASRGASWLYGLALRSHAGHQTSWPLFQRLVLGPLRHRLGRELRFIVCGTAPLRSEVHQWFSMLGIAIYQAYGLAETTSLVSLDRPPVTPGSVGYPLDGCEVRVDGQGEILCRGPNLFRGYWNQPGEPTLAGGWFPTGDLGRLDAEGKLHIEGRLKNLLVLGSGHNVAPEPMERELLATFGEAEHAVVVGHGRPYLCAILTGEREIGDLEQRLDDFNQDRAHYRKIRRVLHARQPVTLENGLLTSTGKLKRAAVELRFAWEIESLYAKD